MATRDTDVKIADWLVHAETLSDHRLISMEIKERQVRRRPDENEIREGVYDLRSVINWREFDGSLIIVRELQNLNADGTSVQENASAITDMMRGLMEEHFPKSKRGVKKVYWWSIELDRLRKELRKCSRIWKRTGREEDRRRFVRARTEYVWSIRKQKKQMWEKLMVDEEGDPWSKVYRIVAGKLKK